MSNTLLVNMFAGAGAGKTTAAWGLCYELKLRGYNVEYVNEVTKDIIWDGKSLERLDGTFKNQLGLINEQEQKIARLDGKVDIIVTDSPLPLYALYAKENADIIEKEAIKSFKEYNNCNFFIRRNESVAYETVGRIHTLEQSKQIDKQIAELLNKHAIGYLSATATDVEDMADVVSETYDKSFLNKFEQANTAAAEAELDDMEL